MPICAASQPCPRAIRPSAVIAALDAWFDRIAGAVHAFGGEVLKFIGDGVLAIFPVVGGAPRGACDAALRAVSAARVGMAHLDEARRQQGLPPLPFGAALHLGEMLWGNIGAADRLDFTAIGPAVNLVSRLEGLCRPLDKTVLVSGAFAAETGDAADPARNACVARHRSAMRRLHRAGELSRRTAHIQTRHMGGSGANSRHEQTLPVAPCGLQASSTAFQTSGTTRP